MIGFFVKFLFMKKIRSALTSVLEIMDAFNELFRTEEGLVRLPILGSLSRLGSTDR